MSELKNGGYYTLTFLLSDGSIETVTGVYDSGLDVFFIDDSNSVGVTREFVTEYKEI